MQKGALLFQPCSPSAVSKNVLRRQSELAIRATCCRSLSCTEDIAEIDCERGSTASPGIHYLFIYFQPGRQQCCCCTLNVAELSTACTCPLSVSLQRRNVP